MRKFGSVLLVVIFVFAVILPVSAQDMMEDKIACDSTLMTLLLVAEGGYGYHEMDTSVFDKGQLTSLFDGMMSMMDDMGDDEMMEEGEAMEEGEMTEEGDMMMDESMMLPHGDVAGEPAECTDLRASVEGFLYDALSMEYGMMDDAM